jgi:hypothetical protein
MNLNDLSDRQVKIMSALSDGEWHLASQLFKDLNPIGSNATLKREIKSLFQARRVEQQGHGRATQYRQNFSAKFLGPIDVDKYFSRTQDDRVLKILFNQSIFNQFSKFEIFSTGEKKKLTSINNIFNKNISQLSASLLKRELERVTIDLSWKSSAIEGNTYTLLETEALLVEGIAALGKSREETAMVYNHKTALEFVRRHHQEFNFLSVSKLEHVHGLLSENLGISKNIRKRVVGITGTNYKPLDNEFQIREALESACQLINKTSNIFSKSLLAILLISYIQPFEDGNKRTARLIGNAILLAHNSFPLSFRSVDITSYKKALLLFYETNNLAGFKNIFIEQARFAVGEYFR